MYIVYIAAVFCHPETAYMLLQMYKYIISKHTTLHKQLRTDMIHKKKMVEHLPQQMETLSVCIAN